MDFHEDDYCQIELLPAGAEAFARQEAQNIREFGEAHKDPGGFGWTSIYLRKETPAALYDLKIGIGTLDECVPSTLRLYERVTTGDSTRTRAADHTLRWGRGGSPLTFAHFDELRVVRTIWFSHFGETFVPDMRSFLSACGQRWDLILADWAWTQVVKLCDESELNAYLSLRAAPHE